MSSCPVLLIAPNVCKDEQAHNKKFINSKESATITIATVNTPDFDCELGKSESTALVRFEILYPSILEKRRLLGVDRPPEEGVVDDSVVLESLGMVRIPIVLCRQAHPTNIKALTLPGSGTYFTYERHFYYFNYFEWN